MKEKIQQLLALSIKKLQAEKNIPNDISYAIIVERTRDKQHGDFFTNIALTLGKSTHLNPKKLAQLIVDNIDTIPEIDSIEIAGPGFINFYLTSQSIYNIVRQILDQEKTYGYSTTGKNQKVNVEFVSANPTGPLHVGHGRSAAYGDAVANILETQGYQVDREYYVNDAGRQMHILAASVWLRYLSLFNDLPHFPVNAYQGTYIIDIAKNLQIKYGDQLRKPLNDVFNNLPKDEDAGGDKEIYIDAVINNAKHLLDERGYSLVFDTGLQTILDDLKDDLAEFGVHYKTWFMESNLAESGDTQRGIDILQQKNYLYQKDGATWFRATQFSDEKDRVVIRENGLTTYFASDIAYHFNKYNRGYIKIIDILGADHHGYAPRIRAFLKAAELDEKKFFVPIVQFVTLISKNEKIKMSTRSGEFISLRELRKEIGNDAARFFYILFKNDQHMDFNLDLAKSKSMDNPVYYIQYAHARVCQVMMQLEDKKWHFDRNEGLAHLDLLKENVEFDLINLMQKYAETLEYAANNFTPHTLAHYLRDLANGFHSYYGAQQFLVEDSKLRNARLCLINAVKQLIQNGLGLLGVSAPEVM